MPAPTRCLSEKVPGTLKGFSQPASVFADAWIERQCTEALQRNLDERLIGEGKNQLTCLVDLSKEIRESLRREFTRDCLRLVIREIRSEEDFKAIFNNYYGPIFRSKCLDNEVRRYNSERARAEYYGVAAAAKETPLIRDVYRKSR